MAIQRLSEDQVKMITSKMCLGSELGVLKIDEEEAQPKPWETVTVKLLETEFPRQMEIVKANMLFVLKTGISQRALNQLKRLAAFKNPEFYKHQAMRMSTYGKDRIICCADDTAEYLCLPRGCEEDLRSVLAEQGMDADWVDSLISQWKDKLTEFLTINESLPDSDAGLKKRGRKKTKSIIGQLGQGKNSLGGIVDIALMQSLNRKGEVKECVKDYGMIIVDECHHVAAVSFDRILKSAKAQYVYGLTEDGVRWAADKKKAFPKRSQCGKEVMRGASARKIFEGRGM